MDAKTRLESMPAWSELSRFERSWIEPKTITDANIKEILVKRFIRWSNIPPSERNEHWVISEFKRNLIVTESPSQYGDVGAVLFAVNGSPPKGYALYIKGNHTLHFYDTTGKRFMIVEAVFLADHEEYYQA